MTRSLGQNAPQSPLPRVPGLCPLRPPSYVGPLRWLLFLIYSLGAGPCEDGSQLWGPCDLQPIVLKPAPLALAEREGPAQYTVTPLSRPPLPQVFWEDGIISGYRRPTSSALDCVLSSFQMTNETVNIWTHFLPTW